jgi:hypothetical protein
MDQIVAPYERLAPAEIEAAAAAVPAGEELRLRVSGLDEVGDPVTFTALVPMTGEAEGAARLEAAGLMLLEQDGKVIVDDVAFGSAAAEAGLDWDQEIVQVLRPVAQPSKYLIFIPALLVLAGVVALQRMRLGLAPVPSFGRGAAAKPAAGE